MSVFFHWIACIAQQRRTALLLPALLLCLPPLAAHPQEVETPATNTVRDTPTQSALTLDTTRVSVHGQVIEAGNGNALARVLVQIEGDARNATLTDGDGRFTLDNVPVGPQIFSLRKPGYRDTISATQPPTALRISLSTHNVIVAAAMPSLRFSMQREAVLHGTVRLDTGEYAEGLTVQLVQQIIENGRLAWQMGPSMQARADGSFRFAHLAPGAYALLTHPWLERTSEATPTEPTWGYTPAFAGEPQPLQLGSGDDAQIDLTLNRALFQPVTVALVGGDPGQSYQATITDAANHPFSITQHFDAATHTLHLLLPDGDHHLHIRSAPQRQPNAQPVDESLLDVHVADHPVALRASLVPLATLPIDLAVEHHSTQPIPPSRFLLEATPDQGWTPANEPLELLHDNANKDLAENHLHAGRYWITPFFLGGSLCPASLTTGSSNLAVEPLTVGLGGSTAPITLTLRDNCAQLTLSLPAGLRTPTAGEEPVYIAYLVPTFASPDIPSAVFLRPSTGGTAKITNITPGDYRLYVLRGMVEFAYRSEQALQQNAQVLHLSDGEHQQITVEVPE